MRNLLTLSALLFFGLSASADFKDFLIERNEQIRLKMAQSEVFRAVGPRKQLVDGTYDQHLDHNNAKDARTFKQRYWVNTDYRENDNSPVIIYICGEGECGDHVFYGAAGQHAERLKATMVALEHRYYGKSQPFADLSNEHLQYLSVDQALKDLIEFKKYAVANFGLKGKWLSIGGSYAGAMSAYLRTLYPNEIVGSLASSAPVEARLDFSAYDRHVAVQAGADCVAATMKVVDEVESHLNNAAAMEKIKADFGASELRDNDDFLYMLADTGAGAVQYGMREQFCSLLKNQGRDGYISATKMVAQLFGPLTDTSAQAGEDISLDKNDGAIGVRQWFYQSCTEFGFWQNANMEPGLRVRSTRINPAYHARLCERLFGLKSPAPVAQHNATFYSPILDPKTTNILFTNGSEDPWQKLSITQDNKNATNPNTPNMIIQGAAHCGDLGGGMDTETAKAKAALDTLAVGWLGL